MIDIINRIFTSTHPYLLDSSHFSFDFFGRKFRVVKVVDARISAVSSNRQYQITIDKFSWGIAIFLFKAPNQFGDAYQAVNKWSQNIHLMESSG